jgi:hypothetical protein
MSIQYVQSISPPPSDLRRTGWRGLGEVAAGGAALGAAIALVVSTADVSPLIGAVICAVGGGAVGYIVNKYSPSGSQRDPEIARAEQRAAGAVELTTEERKALLAASAEQLLKDLERVISQLATVESETSNRSR